LSPETVLVRGGTRRTPYGETSEAIFLTSGFVYDSAAAAEARFTGDDPGFVYSRYGNPTLEVLETRLALLEGAEGCHVTASGMSGVFTALFCHLRGGDHVVASRALFGSCFVILGTILPRYGITTTFVDGADLAAWEAAMRPNTRAVFLETPANPTLDLVDVAAVAQIAHAAGAKVFIDNVFATPLGQKPLELGADVVIYSATKHIDGQGRCLGGIILSSEAFIAEHIHNFLRQTGPSLSPFNAWTLVKGLETLAIRVRQQTETAAAVADVLAQHPKISRLIYPGRADHPQAATVKKQMRAGSTLIGFEVKGGKAATFRFLNALKLSRISNNLGDAKSLVTHPATTTHQRLTPEARAELGISEGFVRYSAGLEHRDDLIEDMQAALEKA
jgi:O-succinylhomoserine sulfhydrylase